MASEREQRREAYLEKARGDIGELEAEGLLVAGNAFAPVLFLKGEPRGEEATDAARLLAGADGKALRASLAALGYAPEGWAALLTQDAGGVRLSPEALRRAIVTLDPDTLVACDETAADALREAYADELAAQEGFDEAMLAPGVVVSLRGMRVMNLGGFEAALSDQRQKQIMWARLKRLPPLGEPY